MPRHGKGIDAFFCSKDFDGELFANESLAKHTSYRIGGLASYYVEVNSLGSLMKLVDQCSLLDIPWTVLGKGTNVLVADEGYRGVVIVLGRDFRNYHLDADTKILSCGAGVSLGAIVKEAFRESLEGLEFAVGTPGSVGGAVRMNAGSASTWIGSRILSVTTLHPERGMTRHPGEQITWGYRQTSFEAEDIIVECEIKLEKADPFDIRKRMDDYLANRKKSQPLTMPSCGSVFRNPQGQSAGALIDQLGLKGYSVGGAQISDVHANFIVNTGDATAHDVRAVIQYIQESVQSAYGMSLVPEVKFLGFE